MAEYGQTLHSAVWRFPIRAAFALLTPRGERLGHGRQAASHGEGAWLAKTAEVRAWLARHFEIVPELPSSS